MGRSRKPQPPPKRGGKIDYPDIFEWAFTKAIPATLELVVGDVVAAAERAVPTVFVAFFAVWLPMPDDYALKNSLGIATLVTFLLIGVVFAVRARRSRMLPSRVVAWNSIALLVAGLITGQVIISGLYQGWVHASAKQEEAAKKQQENEAAKTAADEVKRQAQIADEAAKRAAAAKDEAAHQAAEAAKQICLQARDDAIQKATRSKSSARKDVEECKAQFDETLFTFQKLREFCKAQYARYDNARQQLQEAESRCGTSSPADATGSIDKPK